MSNNVMIVKGIDFVQRPRRKYNHSMPLRLSITERKQIVKFLKKKTNNCKILFAVLMNITMS